MDSYQKGMFYVFKIHYKIVRIHGKLYKSDSRQTLQTLQIVRIHGKLYEIASIYALLQVLGNNMRINTFYACLEFGKVSK